MKIFDRFEIVGNSPAVYIDQIDSLVISDLHLGMESLMAESGTLMPKFQLKEMKAELEKLVNNAHPERLIVCGDIKHEFSGATRDERKEVEALIDFLSDHLKQIILVKGNHDNYLIYAVDKYDNVLLEEQFIIDNYCFMHGDKVDKDIDKKGVDYLIIGHEHPALTLKDKIGVREKLPCFLYGRMKNNIKIVVMPAFSRFASGSHVNRINKKELLSPILKEQVNINELAAIGVDREAGLFEFPDIGKLKKI